MNVIEALLARRTIRVFAPEPVDRETVMAILEPSLRSPSASNTQPWEIYVAAGTVLERLRQAYIARFDQGVPMSLDIPFDPQAPPALQARREEVMALRLDLLGIARSDAEGRKRLLRLNYTFFGAPALVVLCMDRTLTSWPLYDLGLLSQSIALAAQHHGVESAIALNFVAYPDLLRAELGIPESQSVVIGIALGHADQKDIYNTFRSPRRPAEEVITLKGF